MVKVVFCVISLGFAHYQSLIDSEAYFVCVGYVTPVLFRILLLYRSFLVEKRL